MFAAQNGHAEIVKVLLTSTTCNPYIKDNVSFSVILTSYRYGIYPACMCKG